MSKKRVLAIVPTYFPMMGGAERTVDELYVRLGNKGYHTDLVTPNLGGRRIENKKNFTIYRVGKKVNSRYLKFILYQWHEYLKIRKLLKRNSYDLIHISYGFPSVFVMWWLKRKTDVPIVMSEFHLGTGMDITDESQNPFYVNYFLKWAYRNSDAITVISNEQKRFVEKISGRKDVVVVFQGTDEKYFSPKKYDEKIKKQYGVKGPMILTVSRLNKRKNIGDQIKAVKIVAKKFPEVKHLIVGKGEEKEELERLVKNLRMEKNVVFTGFVSEKELPKLYSTADLFLLTSALEGFGIANAEALASGTPVVTYDTKASGDYIINGKTGYITNHEPSLLAKKIIKVLSDSKLLASMSNNARKEIEKKYTWNLYAEKHRRIFDSVQ